MRDKKVVLSIIPNQSYLNVTLNADWDTISPKDNLEDIRNKGHWGVGTCRMRISSEDEIWLVLDYIDQMMK